MSKKIFKGLISVTIGIVLFSVYSYIFDLLYDFSLAIQNLKYLGVYVIYLFIARSWFIALLVVSFHLIYKNAHTKAYKTIEVLIIVLIACIMGKYMGRDDWSLTIDVHEWKYIPIYGIATLTLYFIHGWVYKYPRKQHT